MGSGLHPDVWSSSLWSKVTHFYFALVWHGFDINKAIVTEFDQFAENTAVY